jgi:hypothetical protein
MMEAVAGVVVESGLGLPRFVMVRSPTHHLLSKGVLVQHHVQLWVLNDH